MIVHLNQVFNHNCLLHSQSITSLQKKTAPHCQTNLGGMVTQFRAGPSPVYHLHRSPAKNLQKMMPSALGACFDYTFIFWVQTCQDGTSIPLLPQSLFKSQSHEPTALLPPDTLVLTEHNNCYKEHPSGQVCLKTFTSQFHPVQFVPCSSVVDKFMLLIMPQRPWSHLGIDFVPDPPISVRHCYHGNLFSSSYQLTFQPTEVRFNQMFRYFAVLEDILNVQVTSGETGCKPNIWLT